MNVYIFSYHGTNNVKILWKSSDTIESVLFFFFWFVLQNIIQLLNIIQLMQFCSSSIFLSLKLQVSHIQSIRSHPLSDIPQKAALKQVTCECEHNLNNQFFYLAREKKYLCSEQLKQPFILWFIAKWWKHVMRTQRRQLFFKS